MTPRIGSLCSGYGGLELGLMAVAGGSVAWHVEYDKHPSAVLEARFPGVPNYGDVTTTDWTQVEPVDWLTAGYPCQPFSNAGKRKGSADERHLWPAVADAIGVLRPRRVLLENVAGHVSLGLDVVLADLAALGYDATWGVVRASDAGACHERARVFIAAADSQCPDRGSAARLSGARGEHLGTPGRIEGAAAPSGDPSATPDAAQRGRRGAEGQQRGLGTEGCLPDVAANAADGPSEPQRSRPEPRGRGSTTADPDRQRSQRDGTARPRGAGPEVDDLVATDADDDAARSRHEGGDEGWSGSEPAQHGRGVVEWGDYEPAIRRWEVVTGRAAPEPTEPGQAGKRRLSPFFVEWLMGLPAGWVTDVPIGRGPQLKALGNGVVPQQAALAVRTLLTVGSVAA